MAFSLCLPEVLQMTDTSILGSWYCWLSPQTLAGDLDRWQDVSRRQCGRLSLLPWCQRRTSCQSCHVRAKLRGLTMPFASEEWCEPRVATECSRIERRGKMMYLKLLVGHGYPGQSQVQRQEGRNGNSREKTTRLLRKRNHKISSSNSLFIVYITGRCYVHQQYVKPAAWYLC